MSARLQEGQCSRASLSTAARSLIVSAQLSPAGQIRHDFRPIFGAVARGRYPEQIAFGSLPWAAYPAMPCGNDPTPVSVQNVQLVSPTQAKMPTSSEGQSRKALPCKGVLLLYAISGPKGRRSARSASCKGEACIGLPVPHFRGGLAAIARKHDLGAQAAGRPVAQRSLPP